MCMNNIKNFIEYTYTVCRITLLEFFVVYFLVKMSNPLRLMSYAFLYTNYS